MRLKLPWQNRLSARVVLSLSLLLVLVMLLVMGIQLRQQQATMMQEEEARAGFMAEGLLASLQTLMLTGNGPLARDWLDRVSKQPGVLKAQVIRRTGNEAFFDLKTIKQVNKFLDTEMFTRSALPTHTLTDIPLETFKEAVAGEKITLRDEYAQRLTYLLPIRKLDACNACHGYDASPIRGVLRITTSLKHAETAISEARRNSIVTSGVATLLLALGLFLLVRRQVIRPIQALRDTAHRIDSGDLSASAPVNERRDEIDQLGASFNHMTRSLVEHIAESKALSEYYHHLLDGLSNGVTVYDADGRISYVNARVAAMTGFTEDEYQRLDFRTILKPATDDGNVASFGAWMEQHCKDADAPTTEIVTRERKDGSSWIARIALIPLNDDNGMLREVIEISEDITEDQQRQEEIKWLSNIPEMNPFPIIEVDGISSEIVYMNPATLDYLEQRGLTVEDMNNVLPDGFRDAVNICREQDISVDTVSFEVGDDIMIWQLHPNEHNDNVRAYAIDVTNQVRAEKDALHLAQHDTLTGLPNRRLFFDHLQQATAQVGRTGKHIAVLMLDLDHFKPINDELGHDAGDEALKEAAGRMCTCLRETDTAARFGGDEFTILLTNLNDAGDAEKVAEHLIEIVSRPMQIADQTRVIGASIGIAMGGGDQSSGTASESSLEGDRLLIEADIAMYAAKKAGRNSYRLFAEVMRKQADS